jgi:hypothetical protein
VKSLVTGLDKSTLIRGLQSKEDLTSAGQYKPKIAALVQNWREARGNNDIWACKFSSSFIKNRENTTIPQHFPTSPQIEKNR